MPESEERRPAANGTAIRDEHTLTRCADTVAALQAAWLANDQTEADRLARLLDAADADRERRLTAPGALLGAALWYARHGIAVFPCQPGGKVPATPHGFKDATTEPTTVAAWWADLPAANIGLPTGLRFDVVDLDGPPGFLSWGDLTDRGGFTRPVLAVAFTPHGRHLFIAPTGVGNRTGMLPGVDFRGRGGYVVAPPSRTPGGRYRWADGRQLDPSALPEVTR